MNRILAGSTALVVALLGSSMALAQQSAQRASFQAQSRGEAMAPYAQASGLGDVQLASCDTCDPYTEHCDLGPGMVAGRRGQFIVGGEYLSVRAKPSQAISFLERDTTDPLNTSDTFHQVPFSHEGSFRAFAGYRWSDCGEEIRFTYTNFDTGGDFVSPAANGAGTLTYLADLEILALTPGSYIRGTVDIDLDSYDLGWSKTIPLGSPLMGCCDDGCCDTLGCHCPAWDITFTAAARAVNYRAQRTLVGFNAADVAQERADDYVDFDGFGGRVGMMGRRYIGRRGIASVYMKGDISLLCGDYESRQVENDLEAVPTITTQSISGMRVIPVTEIEAGATLFLTTNTSVSAGYMLSAWHDLGFGTEFDYGVASHYDDANIMGFDGYFVRVETAF